MERETFYQLVYIKIFPFGIGDSNYFISLFVDVH